jgi:hypothetical protein
MTRSSLIVPALAVTGVLALTLAGTIAVVAVPRPTTFNVTAETEWLEMTLRGRAPSRWRFEDAQIVENDVLRVKTPDGKAEPQPTLFSGYFELAEKVRVTISRVALGDLSVYVEALDQGTQTGRLLTDEEVPLGSTGKRIEFIVTNPQSRAAKGETVLLPVAGEVVVGRTIGIETGGATAILRSGRVAMLGRSAFRKDVFEAGNVTLDAGDRFEVQRPDADVPTLGFVVVDERPAFTAAVRIAGRAAAITRPGGSVRTVSASLLGRLFGDEIFRATSALLALATALSTLVTFALQVWQRAGSIEDVPLTTPSTKVQAESPVVATPTASVLAMPVAPAETVPIEVSVSPPLAVPVAAPALQSSRTHASTPPAMSERKVSQERKT